MLSIKNGVKKPLLIMHKNVGMSKPMFNKKSKQALAEKKMSIRHSSGGSSGKKSSSISPSMKEFESMMSKMRPSKKSMFKKK